MQLAAGIYIHAALVGSAWQPGRARQVPFDKVRVRQYRAYTYSTEHSYTAQGIFISDDTMMQKRKLWPAFPRPRRCRFISSGPGGSSALPLRGRAGRRRAGRKAAFGEGRVERARAAAGCSCTSGSGRPAPGAAARDAHIKTLCVGVALPCLDVERVNAVPVRPLSLPLPLSQLQLQPCPRGRESFVTVVLLLYYC